MKPILNIYLKYGFFFFLVVDSTDTSSVKAGVCMSSVLSNCSVLFKSAILPPHKYHKFTIFLSILECNNRDHD